MPQAQRTLADAALLPFRKAPLTADPKTRYWTSNQARDPQILGYTYTDIADKAKSADQLRADFAAKYGWSRRLTPFQQFGSPPADMLPLDLSKAQAYQYTSGVPSASRFRPLVKAAGPLPRTTLLAKVSSAASVAAAKVLPGVQVPPQANVKSSLEQHQSKAPQPVAHMEPSQAPLQATIVASKVSYEWYIDTVVER